MYVIGKGKAIMKLLFETKTRKKEKTCMTYLPGCGRQSEINQIFLRYFFLSP